MESLPPELIRRIASFLPKPIRVKDQTTTTSYKTTKRPSRHVRPDIASVSRDWQLAIETLTFEELHITSNRSDLDTFLEVFSDHDRCSQRRQYLRRLHYDVLLPEYNIHNFAENETDENRVENDSILTIALSGLLQILSRWPAVEFNLALHWNVHSLSDLIDFDEIIAESESGSFYGLRPVYIPGRRHRYSYLSLQSPLPLVPCIRELCGPTSPSRKLPDHSTPSRFLHPGSMLSLLSRLPNLGGTVVLHYTDPGPFLLLQRQLMREFDSSTEAWDLAPKVETLDCSIAVHGISDRQRYDLRLPNLAPLGLLHEPLYAHLRRIIGDSNIETLRFSGKVDPALFWSSPDEHLAEQDEISWASVKYVRLCFDQASLSRRWYFKGKPDDPRNQPATDEPLPQSTQGHFPPGYGTHEEDHAAFKLQYEYRRGSWCEEQYNFRQIPDEETMVPLLEAVARRLAVMPSLQTWTMWTEIPLTTGYYEWYIMYNSPGAANGLDDIVGTKQGTTGAKLLSQVRVYLGVKDWRPPKHLLDLLHKAGSAATGTDAAIYHV